MHTAPVVPSTFTFPGVAGAMLALSRARRQAFLYRCAAADSAELGSRPAPAAAAACEAFARQYEAIVERITCDLESGIFEGNRR